ncbi:MAG: DUF885 family protein [Halobacteriales archaeon]
MTDGGLEDVLDDYVDGVLERNPHVASVLGDHSRDAEIPDGDRSSIEDEVAAAQGLLDDLEGFEGFTADVVRDAVEYDVHEMQVLRTWESDPRGVDALISFVYPLFVREYAPLDTRLEAIASRLEATPDYLEEVRERVDDPVSLYVDAEIDDCADVAGFLQVVADAAGDLERQDVAYRVNAAAEDVVEAFDEHEEWLRGLDPRDDWRLGADELDTKLGMRGLPDHEEVRRLAEAEMSDAHVDLETAADDPRDALQRVESDLPAPSEVLDEYVEYATRARDLCRERLGVPEGDAVEIRETPSYARGLLPVAGYLESPPFDGGTAVYYVTPPENQEVLAEHSRAEVAGRVASDLYPGDHYRRLHARGHPATSLVGRFNDYGDDLVLGWRDHAERLAVDAGLHPDVGFVHARNRIAAAARAYVDVGLQTGDLSVREAASYLSEETGLPGEEAAAEARSIARHAGEHVSRVTGAVEIRRLRSRYDGGEAGFARALLSRGVAPVSTVEREIERTA